MKLANKITLLRIILVPVFMLVLMSSIKYANFIALGIFIICAATDAIDGYVARKYNQITDFGKFVDPLADKLLVISALLIFTLYGQIPLWVTMVVIVRELMVTSLRVVAISEGVSIPASRWGKIKTITQMTAIIAVLLFYKLTDISVIRYLCDGLIYVMAAATVYSGVEYLWDNRQVFKNM